MFLHYHNASANGPKLLLAFSVRQRLHAVCRRWRLVAEAPCFTHKVKHAHGRGAIMAAVERARPGDTVTIAPGFYMVRRPGLLCSGMPGGATALPRHEHRAPFAPGSLAKACCSAVLSLITITMRTTCSNNFYVWRSTAAARQGCPRPCEHMRCPTRRTSACWLAGSPGSSLWPLSELNSGCLRRRRC